MFDNFFKNKKILLTGHTGFKGSWLTAWLLKLGAEVCGLALEPNTNPSMFNILKLENKIEHNIGDIRNSLEIEKVVAECQPEIVFHLAAQPLVRVSYEEPKFTYETNVIGTLNLFEAIRKVDSVKTIINVTSDKCYENKEWVWGYREDEPMGGYDPYSSSKGCVELLSSSYRRSFFEKRNINLSTARAGNVIGGGDWAKDRLIPDVVRALSKNQEIKIRNPRAIRPWQHVLEPLYGYLLLAKKTYEKNQFVGAWNFGPYDSDILTVEEVVKLAIKKWGKGSYIEEKNIEEPHEAMMLKLDISKARYYLKWEPTYNSIQAIEKTIEWYKNYFENMSDMFEYTKKQIEEFENEERNKK
ncbi:CDP-glucose 4,6-dehydratase [Petrotoga sp. HWH.PT.55.6.1]|uniref:CDP-glucose 4,6-dehydratase n=1 Tax=unclassified Petrotoga TaxID=2620614 RepID=UPI000CA07C3B|nr:MULTISPECIES: CDP-glucose 4,6-dehydratase [unclassified Petrotoga]PNR91814.1 CDP-glucose 4,6-dehydratase [Petrotoga sp. HWHPT.55.6.3]RPD35596.1 CDP-glucose 4,6-dehydratase [Petrotoga sp. HWH.PT.55.6.1]